MEFITLGSLALWHHRPKRKLRARVLLIHGLGEHSGRHLNTVDFLVRMGIEVVRFDLRGAGKSGGRRQWVHTFENYVEDAASAQQWILRELEDLPMFVLGHSLGGLIAIHFASIYSKTLHGLILSAPAYKVGDSISPLKLAVGKKLARLIPTMRLASKEICGGLSRDPEVEAAYRIDPLSCHFNTLQQGNEILRAMGEVLEKASHIHCPTMIAHGTSDPVVAPGGSFEIVRAIPHGDRSLHYLPLGRHEPHNDLDKEQYFGLVKQWLEKRIPA